MEEHNQTPAPSKPTWPFSSIFFMVVILAIIAAALSYLVWQQRNLSQQTPKNSAEFEALQKQVLQQGELLRSQQMQFNQWQKKMLERSENSTLAEVSYLVQLANLNLIAGHDAESAKNLLKMAMEKVALKNDPAFSELQKSLESDVSRLSAIASFNIENTLIELGNVNQQIQALSIMPNLAFKPASSNAPVEKVAEPWYKRFLQSFSGLKDLFVIRHVGANAIPLVSPGEEVYLKENIQNKLMLAQWAVIHQKPLIYQGNLKEVQAWLNLYFHNPKKTQPILAALLKLQGLNVRPDFPGLEATLKLLSQLKQNTSRPEVMPRTPLPRPITPPSKLQEPANPEKTTGIKI